MPWLVAAGVVVILFLFVRGNGENGARSMRTTADVPPTESLSDQRRDIPERVRGDAPADTVDPAAPGAIALEVFEPGSNKALDAVDIVLRRDEGIRDGFSVTTFIDVPFEKEGDAWVAADLAPGSYVLSVGAPEREALNVEVHVPSGERVRVRIPLLRNPAVHGFVTDEAGTPLGGVWVYFGWNGVSGMQMTYTSRNGAFHLVPASLSGSDGTAYLVVVDPRRVYAETRCNVSNPLRKVQRVVLARATRVVGRLVPRPADHVRVCWRITEEGAEPSVPVGPDGSFAVTDLPTEEDIYLTIVLPGMAPVVRGPLRLEKAEQLDLGDLEVGPGRSLSFVVRSTNGDAVEGLRVTVLLPAMSREDARVVECPADVALLDLLPDGPVLVRVEAKGLAGRWIRIDKVAEFRKTEVLVRPTGALEAVVLDPDGMPVEGAVIRRDEDCPTFEENCFEVYEVALPPTDAQGLVRVDLAEGTHWLRLEGAESVSVRIRSGESTSVELRPQRGQK